MTAPGDVLSWSLAELRPGRLFLEGMGPKRAVSGGPAPGVTPDSCPSWARLVLGRLIPHPHLPSLLADLDTCCTWLDALTLSLRTSPSACQLFLGLAYTEGPSVCRHTSHPLETRRGR